MRERTLDTECVATTPGIAEAPRRLGEEIWFSDLLGGILRLQPDGTLDRLVPARRGIGGLAPHVEGGVVATGRSLVHVAVDGTLTEIMDPPEGCFGFNDVHVGPGGDLLVGMLRFRPMKGETPVPGDVGRLSGSGLDRLMRGPAWPNGLGIAPDGSDRTYVADFATGTILSIGTAGGVTRLCTLEEGHADGLAVDSTGRIWVATGGASTIVAITPQGRIDQRLRIPASFVSSLLLGVDGEPALITVGGVSGGRGGLLLADLPATGLAPVQATVPVPRRSTSP